MDTLSHNAGADEADLEHLLAHTDTRETRSELRGYFQRLLEFVEASADKLGAVEALQDETLWTQHEGWTFDDPLTRPSFLRKLLGSINVLLQVQWTTGQREADLTERDELLELFESVRSTVLSYVRRKRNLDERILASWRKKHPYFSSAGIIDSEIQSDQLRDLKVDRR